VVGGDDGGVFDRFIVFGVVVVFESWVWWWWWWWLGFFRGRIFGNGDRGTMSGGGRGGGRVVVGWR
jgi:hypothetical protein